MLLQKNGNSFNPVPRITANADNTSASTIPGPFTTEEKAQKKNDVKAISMLLMALPNEHLLTFSQYKDAKTLFEAIQARFGGNDATKKIQKTLLKQIQLAILGEKNSQEDLNMKFLRSLPAEWNTHVVVWRNKLDLEKMSFDDLYNNFKIVEQEVKITVVTSSSLRSSNMAFLSYPSSTNEVDTASIQVSVANTPVSTVNLEQIYEDDLEERDLKWQLALLSMRARRYFRRTCKKITINGSDTTEYDMTKVECFNCHKMGHFARECKSPKSQESRPRNQDNSRKTVIVKDISSKAMVAIDGAGFDWSYMGDDEVPTTMALMAFSDSKGSGQREVRPVWNHAMRVRRNFAPTAVLTKSGIVPISTARQSSSRIAAPVSTARPINTTAPKPIVNVAKSRRNAFQKTHSLLRRPFHQQTAFKNRYLVNTAKVKSVNTVNTAKGKSMKSAVGKQGSNAVKSSACWVWRPKIKVQDLVFKNSGSYIWRTTSCFNRLVWIFIKKDKNEAKTDINQAREWKEREKTSPTFVNHQPQEIIEVIPFIESKEWIETKNEFYKMMEAYMERMKEQREQEALLAAQREQELQQKQNMEDTMIELLEDCRQKEICCMHNDVEDLIESVLNSKLLSINLKSQRLDKEKQEVKNIVEQSPKRRTQPEYSLSMRDEHISTIPEMESDEVIKSSVENLVPIPSESEVTSDNESKCVVPVNDEYSPIFTTFSNPLFDCNNDFTSSDDKSLSNEDSLSNKDVPMIYSNSLFDDEEIIPTKIDSHYFNAESNLLESLLNRDTLIDSSPKFDYLLEEFSELNAEIADMILKSLSPFPILVEDSDSQMEEIDLFLATDDLMPPSIENEDYDSEGDIYFLEEFLSNDTLPLPKNKSSNFDHHDDPEVWPFNTFGPSLLGRTVTEVLVVQLWKYGSLGPPYVTFRYQSVIPRPPPKPPDVEVFFDFEPDTGVLTAKVVDDISEHYVLMPKVLPSQPTLCPNIDTLLSFSSKNEDKVFKPGILSYLLISHQDKITSDFYENPMMMYEGDIPHLDVPFLHFYPP
nr:hypothetical protein [Tanacetum cinerariifolium]